jgi:hypothetical protein
MKHSKLKQVLLAGLIASSTGAYAIVNFESIGPTLGDNGALSLSTTFDDNNVSFEFGVDSTGTSDGIARDQTAYLEQTGEIDSDNGFYNDIDGAYDSESSNYTGSLGLGDYFLRTEKLTTSGTVTPGLFVIEYVDGTFASAASGQIWDIDGTSAYDTEKFIVTAYDENENVLDTDTSPEYSTNDASSLDGLPWEFSVAATGEDLIKYITIEFAGGKTNGVGLAFDNFNATAATIVPEPGTFALLAGMLALTSVMVRRRN